jgi:hypothetical protein
MNKPDGYTPHDREKEEERRVRCDPAGRIYSVLVGVVLSLPYPSPPPSLSVYNPRRPSFAFYSTGGCGPDDRASASYLGYRFFCEYAWPWDERAWYCTISIWEHADEAPSGCGLCGDHHLTTYKKLPPNFQYIRNPSYQACVKLRTPRAPVGTLTRQASPPVGRARLTTAHACLRSTVSHCCCGRPDDRPMRAPKNPHLPPSQRDETCRGLTRLLDLSAELI